MQSRLILGLALFLSACASKPPLVVPHFAADDQRVNTAGFVRETTRMNREVGDTIYTLMISCCEVTLLVKWDQTEDGHQV